MDETTAAGIARAIRTGDRSPVRVVEECLDRIEADDHNAFVTVISEKARERALEAERAVENGDDLGPLHGVPVAIKDAYAYKAGVRNTFGSRAFTDFVPDRSAPLVTRLEDAGAIVVGKTNTPEFAAKGVTDNALAGRTRNPFSPDRTAGGSSGGSAAAVAAGLVPLAQGSDHAGSVRIPASACGVVGVYPTPGRVPQAFRPNAYRYDLPHVSSGPLARTVEDAALALDVMAGSHPAEPFSPPDDPAFLEATDRSTNGFRIGYAPEFAGAPVDPDVRRVVRDAVASLEHAGGTVERTSLDFDEWDDAQDAIMTGLEIMYADLAEDLHTAHGIDPLARRDLVDDHVIDRIETGRTRTALEYKRANATRSKLFRAVQAVFEEYDVLVTPTLAVPPFESADGLPETIDGRKPYGPLGWLLTWPLNLTRHPAASVPAGLVDGVPVGVQIVAPRFDDEAVITTAAALERERPWIDYYDR
ncbi:amidase [Natrarchaeobius chitinivorans]|uniref:Amidase n=1 Tax=Natrarchaeobius chitinivorans TaxID=1679083 RepID=A0A3N6LXB2_NATCH|nr:amidase [Natrarchaeobius chitinivorans]RQG95398.1 amidase [Natrarchaeobius chitinivorans]